MPNDKIIYFPGLNSVRAIAVIFVVFAHIESFKHSAGFTSLFDYKILVKTIENIGAHGVLIFFVLSGFLITFLLLNEKETSKTIDIPKFYLRRMLRIWPLYFLILFLGFFVFPIHFCPTYFTTKVHPDFIQKIIACVFFLPNYVLFNYGHIFSIGVLWSIGTEEQFYLIWPNILKKVEIKNLKRVLMGAFFLVLGIKFFAFYLLSIHVFSKVAFTVFKFLYFDAMIIGGFIALIYYEAKNEKIILFNKKLQFICLITLPIFYFFIPIIDPFTNLIYCPIYAVLILNMAVGSTSIININNKILSYLGTISYGIYIYHSIFIALGIFTIQNLILSSDNVYTNLLLYSISFLGTILISSFSYRYFEKPFLKLKSKFMIVKSGKIY